ncbi:caspase domain-containing protein [Cladochytrium replicatum]|nr:caspase domain-containing protein [Cladochytrium replicatum]
MPRYPQQPPPQAFQSPPRPPQQQPVTPQRPPQQPGFDPFSQPEQQQKQQKAASQQSKPQQQPTAQSSTPFGFDPFSKPKPQAQQPVSSPPKKAAAKAGPPNQSSSNYFSQAPDQEHDDEEEEAEEEEEVTDEESEEEEEVTPVPAKVVQKVQKGLDSRPPRKKALLIGINYPGTKAELKGCINDVRNVYRLLTTRFGYKDTRECMLVLTDEGQKDPQKLPTKQNMLSGFTWLVRDTKPGDSLYLHFSGHGSQQKDNDGDELDGLDDTLVPLDYKKAGMIVDDDLNALLLQSLPSGVQLSVFFDCCHSGTALDLPYIYDQNGTLARTPSTYGAKVDVSQKKSAAHVVMFSGCKDEQTSADASIQGEATGAMTHSLLAAMKSDELPTYRELLKRMLELLRKKGYSQVPQLSSGTPIDMDMLNVVVWDKEKVASKQTHLFNPLPTLPLPKRDEILETKASEQNNMNHKPRMNIREACSITQRSRWEEL